MLPESKLYAEICKMRTGSGYEDAVIGIDPSLLEQIEKKITRRIQATSRQWLRECQPSNSVDPGYVEWLGWMDVWKYNMEFSPIHLCCRAGFLIFGQAGDGAPYTVNVDTNEVHLLRNGTVQESGLDPCFTHEYLPFEKKNMDLCSEKIWPTTMEFMKWLKDELCT